MARAGGAQVSGRRSEVSLAPARRGDRKGAPLQIEKIHEAFDPADVGLFGAIGIVFEAEFVTHLIE